MKCYAVCIVFVLPVYRSKRLFAQIKNLQSKVPNSSALTCSNTFLEKIELKRNVILEPSGGIICMFFTVWSL